MKILNFLFVMALSALSFNLFAQEQDSSYWNTGGATSLTFSQVSLTNWAAGGQNSIAFNSGVSLFADKVKDREKWKNTLDLGYGIIRQDDAPFQKSDDRINLVSNYSYATSETRKWFYTVLLDFRTQFAEGFSESDPDSLISVFMAPGYLTIGTGIQYVPAEAISFTYIPLTGKMTFVTNDRLSALGAYGVDPGKTTRAELGSYFRAVYNDTPLTDVTIDSRLELFTNYESENFGNIDVNWQTSILLRVNKYISTTIFTQILYDDDIKIAVDKNNDGVIEGNGPRTQFKSVLGVGLTYTFGAERVKD